MVGENMENDINKVGIFVTAFITIILGIVLFSTLADSIYLGTDATYTATNEEVTLVGGDNVALANNWVTSITTLNAPNDDASANVTLVEGDNYTVSNLNQDTAAEIFLSDASYDGNLSYVTYEYQDDNYIRSSQSRILIKLIVIFFAIAILAVGIWAMNKMGIMDLIK